MIERCLIVVIATVLGIAQAFACTPREPTQATGPGPHDYTHGVPTPDLWREGDEGQPLALRVRVVDTCGEPVRGAEVQVLHANHLGDHELDRWRAKLKTDARGAFRILTVFPGYTGGLPRHIHFIITHPLHKTLVTRLFFKNDPDVDHGIEKLAMVLEEIQRPGGKGWAAGYEFVLEKS